MMPRYMSTTYIVPSGAVARLTGRKRWSLLVMNSERSYAERAVARPRASSSITNRPTRLPAGSVTNTLRRSSAGNRSPTYATGLPAAV